MELQCDAAFVCLHAEGRDLYEQDEGFRAACRETSAWVLAGRLPLVLWAIIRDGEFYQTSPPVTTAA
ncbi:hypothetical protein [Streptomyces sp. NPDC058755]|uniref:hypothetical protein n=1 Tax=Streptomyces sp. NPDC058755 TaxID=3346624 RepID=UPI0036878289